jgi:hypothetical protein
VASTLATTFFYPLFKSGIRTVIILSSHTEPP